MERIVTEGVEMDRRLLNDIKRGLGRPYILIKNDLDSITTKALVLKACTTDMTVDFSCEGSKGNYLYRLVSLYEVQEYFIHSIIGCFRNNPPYTLFAQLTDLLANFYHDGYKTLVSVHMMEQLDVFFTTKRWTKDISRKLEYIIIAVIENFQKSKAKAVIDRFIQELSVRHRSLSSDFGWAFSYLERYDVAYEKYRNDSTSRKSKRIKIRDFIESVKNDHLNTDSVAFVYNINDFDDIHDLVTYFYGVEHNDESKLIPILRVLRSYQNLAKHRNTSLLKLDPNILIDIYHSVNSENIKKNVVSLLMLSDNPDIRKFGHEIANSNLKYLSLPILLKYYTRSDKKSILSIVYNLPKGFKHYSIWESCTLDVLKFMRCNRTNDLDELLLFFYNNHYGSYEREDIVGLMVKKKLLTDELLLECLHDSNSEVQKIARRAARALNYHEHQ